MTERISDAQALRLAGANFGQTPHEGTNGLSDLLPGQRYRIIGGRRYKATDLGAKDLIGALEAAPNIHRSSSLVSRKNSTPLQT